jgi:hypothetical protein
MLRKVSNETGKGLYMGLNTSVQQFVESLNEQPIHFIFF